MWLQILLLASAAYSKTVPEVEDAKFWRRQGASDIQRMLQMEKYQSQAKNVIIFIGDGMGIQTHAMARIYKGQKKEPSSPGEETSLAWEEFPFTGIIKTYNTDKQVPDSAGTATALFSGVKTRSGVLGVDMNAKRNVCDTSITPRASVTSIADWASTRGKKVGVVSTARITHATPGAMYAHSEDRDWEADTSSPEGCGDIAKQLIQSLQSGKISFALGGGLKNFRTVNKGGVRADTDLVEDFISDGGTFLSNLEDLDNWNMEDKSLGLFSDSHMEWEMYRVRNQSPQGEPSLTAMTRKAIAKLSSSDTGYVLMVEGGRIDHAHHLNQAKKAVEETLELERAVMAALEMTRREDTLVIVTADHSHAVTFNGYAKRGNPILGTWVDEDKKLFARFNATDLDPRPYTTISYGNGPGFAEHWDYKTGFFKDLSYVDTQADEFRQVSTFYLDYETHGGEDVPLYAIGPQAHLLTGVHEQSYLAHLVSYAACLQEESLGCPASGVTRIAAEAVLGLIVIHVVWLL